MRLLGFILITMLSVTVSAEDYYVSGSISNITSHAGGLMIMIEPDRKVPDNCIGTPHNWMLIPEENKTMISVALTAWSMGRGATVYTNPRTSGYCIVNQIDPYEG